MKNLESLLHPVLRNPASDPSVKATAEELLILARQRLEEGRFVDQVEGLISEPLHYEHPSFTYDGERREVLKGEARRSLTNTESIILEALIRNVNLPFGRNELLGLISPFEQTATDEKTINVHVYHLRRALRGEEVKEDPIRTIRGVGYMLVDPTRPTPDMEESVVVLP